MSKIGSVSGYVDPLPLSPVMGTPPAAGKERTARSAAERTLLFRRGTAFAIAAFIPIYVALNDGGYDIVDRQQFALVVWALIALGFAFGILPRANPGRPARIMLASGAALAALVLLSFTWTNSDERTTAELARLLGYGGVIVLALTSLNKYTFRAAAAGLSAAVLGVAALSVGSRLFPYAIGENDLSALLRTDRLYYPFNYWNAVGAWGAMAIAIGIAWSAHARSSALRALSLAAVPTAGLAVYLSYSRGGALASVVAVLAVIAASRNRWTAAAHAAVAGGAAGAVILVARGQPEIADATGDGGGALVAAALLLAGIGCAVSVGLTRAARFDQIRLRSETARWTAPAAIAFVLLLGLGAGGGFLGDKWDEFKGQGTAVPAADPGARFSSAGGGRSELWSVAFDTFEDNPLGGTGPGTFEEAWMQSGREATFVRDAHSIYIEQLAELGLAGFILLIGFLGSCIWLAVLARSRVRRTSDAGACAAMIAAFAAWLLSAGVDWMWEMTAVTVVALGGIAIAGAAASGRPRRPGLWAGGVPVAVAAVAVAVVIAALQVPGAVSTERLRASQEALNAGELRLAGELAQEAVDAEPWAASPYAQRAAVEESRGDLVAARRSAEEAISHEPTNWRLPLLLARIELALGDRASARRTFSEGHGLAPLSPYYVRFSPLGRKLFGEPGG